MIIKGNYLVKTSRKYPYTVYQTEYIVQNSYGKAGKVSIGSIFVEPKYIGKKVKLKMFIEIVDDNNIINQTGEFDVEKRESEMQGNIED